MEEQSSICLQKMMIIMLSVILFGLLFTFSFLEKDELIAKAEVLSPNNVFIYNAKVAKEQKSLARKLDEARKFRESLITVNEINDDENDIISIEQIAYAAVTEIEATEDKVIDNSMDEMNERDTNEKEITNNAVNTETVANAVNAEAVIEQKENEIDTDKSKNDTKYVSYKSLAENNPPAEYKSVYEVSATAYCLCKKCCGKSPSSPNYGMTASGLKIVPGTGVKAIAVDTSLIPLGSKVYVEGLNGAWDYGYATAADTGSAIKNNKIDLYMDTHSECLSWGRKTVKVYVVE